MNYQKLFNHMQQEHGLTLLESEMREIMDLCQEDVKPVPYQCCPKCEGSGLIWNSLSTTVGAITCDVCNGSKIITMYVPPKP